MTKCELTKLITELGMTLALDSVFADSVILNKKQYIKLCAADELLCRLMAAGVEDCEFYSEAKYEADIYEEQIKQILGGK